MLESRGLRMWEVGMERNGARVFVATCLIALLQVPALGQEHSLTRVLDLKKPIAMVGRVGSDYYLLTSEGVVYRYDTKQNILQFSKRFSLPIVAAQAVDIALAQDQVFVTAWVNSIARGKIYRFDLDGSPKNNGWSIQHIPSGIDYDANAQILYFATSDSNELYAIDVTGAGEPKYVCETRAGATGAIALDSVHHLVYAADVRNGQILAVDISRRTSRVIVEHLGGPAALLVDADARALYVADYVRGKVFAIELQSGHYTSKELPSYGTLRRPTGIAPGPNNSVFVADSEASGVFLLPALTP